MNRFAWILAVPYVVSVSSVNSPNCPYMESYACKQIPQYYVSGLGPTGDKETAEDLAAALNEAHERRTAKRWDGNTTLPAKQFNYKSACGQSDCGADK